MIPFPQYTGNSFASSVRSASGILTSNFPSLRTISVPAKSTASGFTFRTVSSRRLFSPRILYCGDQSGRRWSFLSVDLLRGDPVLFRYKAVPLIPGTCQAAGPKAMTPAARNTAVPKSDYSSSNTRIPRSTTPAECLCIALCTSDALR